jgi:hypothetical protein
MSHPEIERIEFIGALAIDAQHMYRFINEHKPVNLTALVNLSNARLETVFCSGYRGANEIKDHPRGALRGAAFA